MLWTSVLGALASSPWLTAASPVKDHAHEAPREALLQSVVGLRDGELEGSGGGRGYSAGQAVTVECLDRNINNGEHITNDKGLLQYSPFSLCRETGLPLEFRYGIDEDITCTLESVPHELFHLLEYYLHNDVPLTCRIPTIPLLPRGQPRGPFSPKSKGPSDSPVSAAQPNVQFGIDNPLYTPFVLTMAGVVDETHIHLSNSLNVIMHTNPARIEGKKSGNEWAEGVVLQDGAISASNGYSSAHSAGQEVIEGQTLTIKFAVRWFGTDLPALSRMPSTSSSSLFSFRTAFLLLVGFLAACGWVSRRLSRGEGPLPKKLDVFQAGGKLQQVLSPVRRRATGSSTTILPIAMPPSRNGSISAIPFASPPRGVFSPGKND